MTITDKNPVYGLIIKDLSDNYASWGDQRISEMQVARYRAEQLAHSEKPVFIDFDPHWCSRMDYGNELLDMLLDDPVSFRNLVVAAAGQAILHPDPLRRTVSDVRIINFPKEIMSAHKSVRDITHHDDQKFVVLTGTVTARTMLKTVVQSVKWECGDCGGTTPVIIDIRDSMVNPSHCSLCRSKKLRRGSEQPATRFSFLLEELPENVNNSDQLLSMKCVVTGDHLANLESWEALGRGTKVRVWGRVYEKTPKAKNDEIPERVAYLAVMGFDVDQSDYGNIAYTPEQVAKWTDIATKHSLVTHWGKHLYTGIYGLDRVKESLIAQMVGNPNVFDTKITRGIIHILLVGDPGVGKSTLAKYSQIYALKSRYSAGSGASGVGLTASVAYNEDLGGWTLQPGAMPLSHKGLLVIDEVDKIGEVNVKAMHEALEQMTISVNKAGINATLRCETSVLAAGNPKDGRFDDDKDLYEQIDLPPAFLSRFDLVWILVDEINAKHTQELAKLVGNTVKEDRELVREFKAYQLYAKQLSVVFPKEVEAELNDWYESIRTKFAKQGGGKHKTINPRILEGAKRLARAKARAELRAEVAYKDVAWAKETFLQAMKLAASDPITGELDFSKIETGRSHGQLKLHQAILEFIKAQPDSSFDDLKAAFPDIDKHKLETELGKLQQKGDVIEIRADTYRVM